MTRPCPQQGGIIAAGEGTRLRADGFRVSKPMVPVAGRPLIDHALDRFRAAGIRKLTIVINEASDDCRRWLEHHAGDFDLDMVVRSTPSSYATFRLVADRLAGAPTVITTVDLVMPVDDFQLFVGSASAFAENAMVLGVTGHVDDENPLWVTLDPSDKRIRQIGGREGTHVTAGLYRLPAQKPADLRPPLRGFGTISAGWSPIISRFTASFCLACSISTGPVTSRPPKKQHFAVSARRPNYEYVCHDMQGHLP